MNGRKVSWAIAVGVVAILVAGLIDAVRSARTSGSAPIQTATAEESAARETAIPVQTTAEALPRCTAQNIGVSIDVLGGKRVRLATLEGGQDVQSRAGGDFSPGFEQLIDVPYLAKPQLSSCDRPGPFTAFVIVGPHSPQRKLSGSEVGCFRGG
jgi:hypothetical protein